MWQTQLLRAVSYWEGRHHAVPMTWPMSSRPWPVARWTARYETHQFSFRMRLRWPAKSFSGQRAVAYRHTKRRYSEDPAWKELGRHGCIHRTPRLEPLVTLGDHRGHAFADRHFSECIAHTVAA